jgi:hypothetical protein
MTLYQILPQQMHGSFFMQVIQKASKLIDSMPESEFSQKSLRYSLYMLVNLDQQKYQELAAFYKGSLSRLYKEMGAGTTYTPTERDRPKRVYRLT